MHTIMSHCVYCFYLSILFLFYFFSVSLFTFGFSCALLYQTNEFGVFLWSNKKTFIFSVSFFYLSLSLFGISCLIHSVFVIGNWCVGVLYHLLEANMICFFMILFRWFIFVLYPPPSLRSSQTAMSTLNMINWISLAHTKISDHFAATNTKNIQKKLVYSTVNERTALVTLDVNKEWRFLFGSISEWRNVDIAFFSWLARLNRYGHFHATKLRSWTHTFNERNWIVCRFHQPSPSQVFAHEFHMRHPFYIRQWSKIDRMHMNERKVHLYCST